MQTWSLAAYLNESDAVEYAKNYAATEPDDWHAFEVIGLRVDTCVALPVAQTKLYDCVSELGQVLHTFSKD